MAKININKTMEEIVYLTNQLNGLKMLLLNKKEIMAAYFTKSGKTSLSNSDCTVYTQERTQVEYDIPKLKEALPKEVYSLFVENTYEINEWKSFVNFCKIKGITPKELKPFIHITQSVDKEKLSKLYDKGKISVETLQKCSDVKVTKSIALKLKGTNDQIPIK